MNHLRGLLPALCLLLVVGCSGEESVQEKMLRIAQERSKMRKAEKETDAADERIAAEQGTDAPVAKNTAAEDPPAAEKIASDS